MENIQTDYTLGDLRKHTEGMSVFKTTLNYDFSEALIETFGKANAIKWFYNLPNEHLDNRTPYEVVRDDDEGKRIISEYLDDMLTGVPS